jgi:hypothetical protein
LRGEQHGWGRFPNEDLQHISRAHVVVGELGLIEKTGESGRLALSFESFGDAVIHIHEFNAT